MNVDESGGVIGITGHHQVDEPLEDHAEGFTLALQDALDTARKNGVLEVGETYDSPVKFSVGIRVTNPPWIGDYRVHIDPKKP